MCEIHHFHGKQLASLLCPEGVRALPDYALPTVKCYITSQGWQLYILNTEK